MTDGRKDGPTLIIYRKALLLKRDRQVPGRFITILWEGTTTLPREIATRKFFFYVLDFRKRVQRKHKRQTQCRIKYTNKHFKVPLEASRGVAASKTYNNRVSIWSGREETLDC